MFYESPHKLIKTLEQFTEIFGDDRPVSVSRELSKLYEETLRGTLAEVLTHFRQNPHGANWWSSLPAKNKKVRGTQGNTILLTICVSP